MSGKRSKLISLIVSVVIAVALLFIGIKVVKQRAYSYFYNPKLDYCYSFSSSNAKLVPVELNDGFLDLTSLSAGVNTVFAEIVIQSTLKGFINEPEVKMIANGDTISQNLECRVRGKRYLNISSLVQKGNLRIKLLFKGCKLKSNQLILIAYRNPDLLKEKILILAPHPDDAEIAAYGLYASYPQNTYIATITAGDAGSMRYDELYYDSLTHYLKKGKVRVWNSLTVPQLGGISAEHAINLGYFDALLKKMHGDTTAHGFSRYLKTDNINLFRSSNCTHLPDSIKPESSWRSLVNDLKYLIIRERPTVILSTYPALDWHFDHKFTTVALLQAMKELNYDSCQLWLYTNHLPLNERYPFGKEGSAIGLPPYFMKEPIFFDRLCSFPLSATLQADKALALDAMNDLRPDTQYRNTKASWLQTKKNFYDKLYLDETDYFRRSVRSNELFFVIDGKNALQPDIQTKLVGQL
jgi:LmbE family N-acetylglucosaminyl deacetylase